MDGTRHPVNALYLMRHGQTQANADGRLRGTLPLPVDAAGMQQVVRTALKLRHRGIGLILASPMERAQQSAHAVAAVLDVPQVWTMDFLRPWFYGELAGMPTGEGDKALRQLIANPQLQPPGGEPFAHFAERWGGGLKELLDRAQHEPVLAVTHSRNIYLVPRLLTGSGPIPVDGPPQPGHGVRLRRKPTGDFWTEAF